jgi:GNAT superfamily N-acetyltransferase
VTAGVRLAVSEDVKAIADVWAIAMQSEPMVYWPLSGDTREAIRAMFSTLAQEYVAMRSVWVDRTCRAAAAWLAPDLVGEFAAVEERVGVAIAPHTEDNGKAHGRFWEWVSESMPDEPMWFLDVVAVSPQVQRCGLGTLLIRHGLTMAQNGGVPAMLETATPTNVDYYRRFGFDVWLEDQVPDGGLTVWFMVKRP